MKNLSRSEPSQESSYSFAVKCLVLLVIISGIFRIQYTYPLLFLLLPALYLSSFLPAENWEKVLILPFFILILAGFTTYLLALYDVCSTYHEKIAIGGLNGISILGLSVRRLDLQLNRFKVLPQLKGDLFAVSCLILVLGIHFFYGMAFPFISFNNSPYPSFAQMGLDLIRSGSFHLLLPSESCYNTTGYFYTIAFPGLISWISSCIPFQGITTFIGFFSPLLLTSFCGIFLAVAFRLNWHLKTAVLSLLLLMPSYALFKIFFEIDSDTPGPACIALFLYLLIRLTETQKSRDSKSLWMFVALNWAFSWWIRIYLGIFCSFTLFALMIFSPVARISFKNILSADSWVWLRPVRMGLLFVLLLLGPFWELLLWVHTGTPMAPKSVMPFGLKVAVLKPEFARYQPALLPGEITPTGSPILNRIKFEAGQIKYDFFPVVTNGGWKNIFVKSGRALVHGNTFSIIFLILFLLGCLRSLKKLNKVGIFSPEGIALSYLTGIGLLFLVYSYFPKALYSCVPILLFFVGSFLNSINKNSYFFSKVSLLFCAGMTFVFAFSFLWSGVGTWPKATRWALFNTSIMSPEYREWVKNEDVLKPALEYLRTVPPQEKFLYFHPEPGHQISFELDRRPFWEEYHYNSQRLAALHQLGTRKKVLLALKALGIHHIVLTFDLERFLGRLEKEILPQMLLKGDPAIELVASSTGATYKIYRINFPGK